MPIVGLTGGFGTGKSYVAAIFKELGAEIVDADKLAHEALEKGSDTYKKIVAAFGKSVMGKTGSINRRKLGKIVFDDKKRLAALNRIVHPVVIKEIKKKIKANKSGILVIDAPLICETELSGLVDLLVVVSASRQNQISRCTKKFKLKKEDVCKRMACQTPLKTKIEKADYVINNNGTRKGTIKQVSKIWQTIKKGAKVWR